jgi:DNA topoisomerase-1
VLKFDGFLKVYQEGKDQADEEDEELKHRLPAVAEGEHLRFKRHQARAALHRAAAALQRSHAGEAPGSRRRGPALHLRFHPLHHSGARVRQEGGGRFTPTELGMVVTDLLLESFDDIFDVTYTARMEEELDEIEEGKLDWRAAMAEFYERFDKDLKHAEEHMTDIKRMEKPTDLMCEKCGKPLVIKWGKHGSFIACTGYPECTYTRELTVDLPDVDKADLTEQGDEEYCENCGRPMVLKKGRFGTFYACSGYPDCKTTKQIGGQQKKPDQPLDEKCPQCGNNLVLKTAASASSRRAAITPPASTSSRKPSG